MVLDNYILIGAHLSSKESQKIKDK